MTTNQPELSDKEREALETIKRARRLVATITVRELGSELGYESVSGPQRLIESLEDKGLISRDKRGIIEVLPNGL